MEGITITTNNPVALTSLDHIYPHGTAWDNSVWQPFNDKLHALAADASVLDIGCAGGGFVKSLLDDGHMAVGVEGSDYSKVHQRAEWATIPDNLFTADARGPFHLSINGRPMTFDVVTAWEFFEHIWEQGIDGVMRNVDWHLKDGGAFIVSIATTSAGLSNEGIEHHVTIRDSQWWLARLSRLGWIQDYALRDYFDPDWVRGPLQGCVNSLCTVLRRG